MVIAVSFANLAERSMGNAIPVKSLLYRMGLDYYADQLSLEDGSDHWVAHYRQKFSINYFPVEGLISMALVLPEELDHLAVDWITRAAAGVLGLRGAKMTSYVGHAVPTILTEDMPSERRATDLVLSDLVLPL